MKCHEGGLAVGETIMRISEVRNKRILLTPQERKNMAQKEGREMCFLTRAEKACHLLSSLLLSQAKTE